MRQPVKETRVFLTWFTDCIVEHRPFKNGSRRGGIENTVVQAGLMGLMSHRPGSHGQLGRLAQTSAPGS